MPDTDPSANTADGNALPMGTRLGEFELRRVIGVGGFGIVYLAFDHGLEREVAIKEYMPSSLASRTATMHVSSTSPTNAESFALGLRSFVNEARLLARFDHPSLIKVLRFWEDRGTAYMVMPLHRGRTLREVRQAMSTPPDEAWLRRMLEALLGALDVLHSESIYHRDIAPDNILLSDDSVPMLLDFGAARHVLSGRSQMLTAILKPSYAPIEQYGETTKLRQGAWTDFYALGATLHYAITQAPPPPSTARMVSDEGLQLEAATGPSLSLGFVQIVEWMLAPRPSDRPQSVAELREVLAGRQSPPTRVQRPELHVWERTAPHAMPPEAVRYSATQAELTVVQPRQDDGAAAPPPVAARAPSGRGLMFGLVATASTLVLAVAAWWALGRNTPTVPAPAAAASIPGLGTTGAAAAATGATLSAAPDGRQAPASASTASAALATPGAQNGGVQAGPAALDSVPQGVASKGAGSAPRASGPGTGSATGIAVTPTARAAASQRVGSAAPRPPGSAAAPAAYTATPAKPPEAPPLRQRQAEPTDAAVPRNAAPNRPAEPYAAPAVAANPREQCGGRMLLALHSCLVRECVKPEYRDHEQCAHVRLIEERAKNLN